MAITDLYNLLFGKGAIQDGNVIDMAEHGRVGNVSTGAGFKRVLPTDASGNQIGSTASPDVTTINDIYAALKVLINYQTRPIWFNQAQGTLRVQHVSAGGSPDVMGTLSAVSSVVTLSQMAGYPLKQTLLDSQELNSWQALVRARFTTT